MSVPVAIFYSTFGVFVIAMLPILAATAPDLLVACDQWISIDGTWTQPPC